MEALRVVSVVHDSPAPTGRERLQVVQKQHHTILTSLASKVPYWGRPRPFRGHSACRRYHMKKSSGIPHDEPVGIVISGGHPSSEAAPRFSAYIWAPGPEDEGAEGVRAA